MEFKSFEFVMYIIQVIVISLGLIGNVISFLVFSRKKFKKNSISTYCRALAIFDSLILFELIQNVGQLFSFSIINQNEIICKLFFYILALFSSIPAWILVAFSIDKMLNMRPKRIVILRKKRFQFSVVSVIVVFNLLLYIGIPINLVRQNLYFYYDAYYCDISSLTFFTVFIIGYLIETAIIPFLIMLISSIATIRLLVNSRKTLELRCSFYNRRRKRREAKFAISSLAFNIMFITLKTPIVIVYCLIAFGIDIDLFFYQVALFLFFLNAPGNFYVHFATNSIFRREFYLFCRLRKQPRYLTHLTGNYSVNGIFVLPMIHLANIRRIRHQNNQN